MYSFLEYSDNFFTIYNAELKINGFSLNYCMHKQCYNYIANYFINQCNNKNNIINTIYGDVYIFKLHDLNEFITFNNNEIKHIIDQFSSVL